MRQEHRIQPDHAAVLAQGVDARRVVESSPGSAFALTRIERRYLPTWRTTWSTGDRRRQELRSRIENHEVPKKPQGDG
jgi:hypothetical protein